MLSLEDIIRAWKDESFRDSLTEEQRSQLPENPAGIVELQDEELESLQGGKPAEVTLDVYCWYWSYFTK